MNTVSKRTKLGIFLRNLDRNKIKSLSGDSFVGLNLITDLYVYVFIIFMAAE